MSALPAVTPERRPSVDAANIPAAAPISAALPQAASPPTLGIGAAPSSIASAKASAPPATPLRERRGIQCRQIITNLRTGTLGLRESLSGWMSAASVYLSQRSYPYRRDFGMFVRAVGNVLSQRTFPDGESQRALADDDHDEGMPPVTSSLVPAQAGSASASGNGAESKSQASETDTIAVSAGDTLIVSETDETEEFARSIKVDKRGQAPAPSASAELSAAAPISA